MALEWSTKERTVAQCVCLLGWSGGGWGGVGDGSLCAPFSGIPLTPGKPGFLDGRCSLCVLSEALSDLVSTEEIVH